MNRARVERLVRVEIRPGQWVKMWPEDAARLGYAPVGQKARRPPENKMREPEEDKAAEPEEEIIAGFNGARWIPDADITPDDFTTIPGIGPGTAADLHALGIVTFKQLREADLGDLPWRARQAVEEWRASD